ncbi:MAG: phosphoenolpyruvate carboxylase [Flavobacteriaceae bacterium]|nr:phosphoenolpyruvate carboxylase [Flavobacteriaceae bacterium]
MKQLQQLRRLDEFKRMVLNKFNIYNSLFLNLPYTHGEAIGSLLPVMLRQCEKGLRAGKEPQEILEIFFTQFAELTTEQEQMDFMFKIVQYVERQVVLYDSVEDAAYSKLLEYTNSLSIHDYFELVDKNKNWDKIADKLSSFSARIVLTAHPTQFYSPAILDLMSKLRTQVDANDLDAIDLSLQQLGLTSLIQSKKPTPYEEAQNIIHILRHTYYDAIGELFSYVKKEIGRQDFDNYNIIKLGFWPGGDRDGNPYVTAAVTKQVADALRINIMKCYYNEIKSLRTNLTFKGVQEPLNKIRDLLYKAMFDANFCVKHHTLITHLQEIKTQLDTHYHSLYAQEIQCLIQKVHIFKSHFASLDIRQDHSKHLLAVIHILRQQGIIQEDLSELDQAALVDCLLEKDLQLDPDSFDEPIVSDTLRNIRQLANIQETNGEDGCHRYIISNSEDIYSVLFVFALFRWSGYKVADIRFDIVPLFETMKGMQNSGAVMQALFDIPMYRQHVQRRGDTHTIMLGFSDGTKDGGYLKANWSILKTKEALSKVCKENQIKVLFFDGRGGPPARGGGKTHRFYAAQTKDVANHQIQMTVQGQTITSTYGTKTQFKHHAEQLLTAGLSNNIFGKENTIEPAQRELIETLSEGSFAKYEALKQHPSFIPYLENRSTLKYYTRANIGSRPGKRGNNKQLNLSDLRAISFVGSWSQLKQNVPGYFGLGTALKACKDAGKLDAVKNLFEEVPFFKALMLNSMMSLAKTNFELTSYMQNDAEFGDFWQILKDEYDLSKSMLLEISGQEQLMQNETISRESVKIREQIVLPLLVIQQYALYQIAKGSPHADLYAKIVTRSLYGNINASRNSA